jgi:hypothetical protein
MQTSLHSLSGKAERQERQLDFSYANKILLKSVLGGLMELKYKISLTIFLKNKKTSLKALKLIKTVFCENILTDRIK